MASDRISRWALLVLAALLGAGIALLDRRTEEVQPAALLLLVCAGALAFARPRDAWAYALLVGAGVPMLDFVTRARGIPPPWPAQPGSSLVALIPAVLGALVGALVRLAVRSGKGV
jgi:hypothetical protein